MQGEVLLQTWLDAIFYLWSRGDIPLKSDHGFHAFHTNLSVYIYQILEIRGRFLTEWLPLLLELRYVALEKENHLHFSMICFLLLVVNLFLNGIKDVHPHLIPSGCLNR
jgi:hypothetical protein